MAPDQDPGDLYYVRQRAKPGSLLGACSLWGLICLTLFSAVLAMAVPTVGCAPVDPAYLEADRLTYRAICGEYERYVATDPDLTDEERRRRGRLLESWAARLDRAEKEASGGGAE